MRTGNGRKVTHKEFIATAGAQPVTYEYPGTFRAGACRVEIGPERLSRFLDKLSSALSFEDYGRLTRSVWVAHIKEQQGRYDPFSSSRPDGPG